MKEWYEIEELLEHIPEEDLVWARKELAETEIAKAKLSPETIERLRRGEGPP